MLGSCGWLLFMREEQDSRFGLKSFPTVWAFRAEDHDCWSCWVWRLRLRLWDWGDEATNENFRNQCLFRFGVAIPLHFKGLLLGYYMTYWLPLPSALSWTSWWHIVLLWLCSLLARSFEHDGHVSVQWKAQTTAKLLKVPKGSLKPHNQWIQTLQYTDQQRGCSIVEP